jgi:hypothetical protein
VSEPRSELRLRDLGREAEYAVDLPDLASLERRGRAMRFRRQAGVVAAAAVLATVGVFLFQDRSAQGPQPAPAPEISTYPGVQMQDLLAGTYELTPSLDGTDPTVLITVPSGWNSWVGPNRFDGSEKPGANDEALQDSSWLVGVTVVKVTGAATEQCQPTVAAGDQELTYDETVEAISGLPGYQARELVDLGTLKRYQSTRLELTPSPAQQECARDSEILATDANGGIGMRGVLDVHVLDVEGTTYVVIGNQVGDAPQEFVDEQSRVLASVDFVVPG